jgi:hypothetical protein
MKKIIISNILFLFIINVHSQTEIKYKGKELNQITESFYNGSISFDTKLVGTNPIIIYNTLLKSWIIEYTDENELQYSWKLEYIKEFDDYILMKDDAGDYWEIMNDINERGVLLINKNRQIGTPYIRVDGIVNIKTQQSSITSNLKKMFTKTPNKWVETDANGKPISAVQSDNTKYEIYFDTKNDYGYLLAIQSTGEKEKMDLKKMYKGKAKGLTVYYFQSSDGGQKISTTAEENGLSIYNYADKKLTIFYYQ